MTSTATAASTTGVVQINRIYIKASAQRIWDAITTPEWSEKYGYGGRVEYDLRPGGTFRSIADAAMQQAGMPEVVVGHGKRIGDQIVTCQRRVSTASTR